jgi:hypothetical protein
LFLDAQIGSNTYLAQTRVDRVSSQRDGGQIRLDDILSATSAKNVSFQVGQFATVSATVTT